MNEEGLWVAVTEPSYLLIFYSPFLLFSLLLSISSFSILYYFHLINLMEVIGQQVFVIGDIDNCPRLYKSTNHRQKYILTFTNIYIYLCVYIKLFRRGITNIFFFFFLSRSIISILGKDNIIRRLIVVLKCLCSSILL